MYRMLHGAPQTELEKFRGLLEYRNRMALPEESFSEGGLLRSLRRPAAMNPPEENFLGAAGYIRIHGRHIEVTESGNRLLEEMRR
jgi:hypothetical protein